MVVVVIVLVPFLVLVIVVVSCNEGHDCLFVGWLVVSFACGLPFM